MKAITKCSARAVVVAASLFAAQHSAQAQTPAAKFVDSARVELDRAVHDMDAGRIDRTIILLDRALVAFPDDPYLLHYRGFAAYWRATGAFMSGMKEKALPDITQGLADLAKSAEHLPWPETFELEAALNGFRMAIDPGLGPTIGPLTARLSGEASKLGPNNPRVFLLQAYLAEMAPPAMGGGPARVKAMVDKAIAAFSDDHPAPLAPAWGREEAESMQRRLAAAAAKPNP
jgi:hypothetical protein